MDDEIGKDAPKIQADNQSIAIGEINITGTVTGNITIGHTVVQPADARLRHELGILLKNVQTTWIHGVLERSVHEAALLELGLELREEAVDNPWRMVIEGPDQTQQTLPRGRKIKDIFDEANRLLLILGEPGSGKTTTLLQLARDLIAEVDLSTFTQPVPVILNLSTWTNKAQPLDEWLVAELNSKYRLPKKDGQRWLKERRILPLLDGLDEVRAENRAACVERINQLVTDYGLQGMVVCSRIKDYTDLNVRLAFYRAIYVQPLTPEQVNEYLEKAGDKLASLRAILQSDEALKSMAQSPLILNIMSLAYQNTSAEELSDSSLNTDKARRKHLFDTYIDRMFKRKASMHEYDNDQTRHRLSWLARNMQNHNQEIFLIEGLQPSWLSTRRWQWVYTLVSRLIAGLSIGFIFGLVYLGFTLGGGIYDPSGITGMILYFTFVLAHHLHFILHQGFLLTWLIAGLIIGVSAGTSIGFFDILRFEWLRRRTEIRKFSSIWWSVLNVVIVWLIVGFVLELVLVVLAIPELEGLGQLGLMFGLFWGLIFGVRGSQQSLEYDIQTVEALRWAWRKALRGGLIGVIGGLSFGLVYFLGVLGGDDLLFYWDSVIFPGLLFGIMGMILNGLRYEIIETKSIPNQGIVLSIRNAIFGGVIAGSIFGLISRLIGVWSGGILFGLTFILSFSMVGVLWYGGLDVIQHYVLRLILLRQGQTPPTYARFLDYAVDRIFLQKVGGGYRFIHRLLLEHFAEMNTARD